MEYIKRLIHNKIHRKITISSVTVIKGPKYVGKSTVAQQFCNSFYKVPSNKIQLERLARNPNEILIGTRPRFIDEWQYLPILWDAVRDIVDNDKALSCYILSGSSTPNENENHHDGSGRFAEISMSTLSLQEMNQINMVVSFIDLISKPLEVESFGEANSVEHDKSVLYNASLLCKGGFPLNYINDFDEKTCIEKNRDYITQLCSGYKKTNADYASFKFNKNTMFKVVNAISRRIMQEYNIDSIAFESDIDHKTCVRYLDILKNMYIIDEFYPFKPHIFSNPKKTPKIYIFDPCFAVAALNTNSQELVNNVQIYINNKRNNKDDFGFFFEAQVIKQLKLFAELSDANIGFFTNKDFEIDCIIEYKNHMSLYEIKTGSFLSIKDGIEAIKRFKKLLTPEQLARVTTANIITAGNHMYYDEESAVNIIPIKYLFFPTDSKT